MTKSYMEQEKKTSKYFFPCFELLQGTFALGRLIAIPCATRLTAAFMLSCNLVKHTYLLANIPVNKRYVIVPG